VLRYSLCVELFYLDWMDNELDGMYFCWDIYIYLFDNHFCITFFDETDVFMRNLGLDGG